MATDQDHFALDHPNKLVFGSVPVALARPLSGWDTGKIYTELGETGGSA
jgi:hypothetical protein